MGARVEVARQLGVDRFVGSIAIGPPDLPPRYE
jgi:hypothetical protein